MKLKKLISVAGINFERFPRMSEIDIELLDSKDNELKELKFSISIFIENPNANNDFFKFLYQQERSPVFLPQKITGRLTADALCLHWPSNGLPAYFKRHA